MKKPQPVKRARKSKNALRTAQPMFSVRLLPKERAQLEKLRKRYRATSLSEAARIHLFSKSR